MESLPKRQFKLTIACMIHLTITSYKYQLRQFSTFDQMMLVTCITIMFCSYLTITTLRFIKQYGKSGQLELNKVCQDKHEAACPFTYCRKKIMYMYILFHKSICSCTNIDNILFLYQSLNFWSFISFIVKMHQHSIIIFEYIKIEIGA